MLNRRAGLVTPTVLPTPRLLRPKVKARRRKGFHHGCLLDDGGTVPFFRLVSVPLPPLFPGAQDDLTSFIRYPEFSICSDQVRSRLRYYVPSSTDLSGGKPADTPSAAFQPKGRNLCGTLWGLRLGWYVVRYGEMEYPVCEQSCHRIIIHASMIKLLSRCRVRSRCP